MKGQVERGKRRRVGNRWNHGCDEEREREGVRGGDSVGEARGAPPPRAVEGQEREGEETEGEGDEVRGVAD